MKNTKTLKTGKHQEAVVVCSIIGRKGSNAFNGRGPHTLKEILQRELPNLWNEADNNIRILKEWQKLVVRRLPKFKKKLPDDFEKLKRSTSQISLLNYIKLRSIYGMSEKLWETIDYLCHQIAENHNGGNKDNVDDLKHQLDELVKRIEDISVVNIIEDNSCGFFRLYQTIESFNPRLDFPVFKTRKGIWSYYDITGTIHSHGLQYEYLVKDSFESQDPTTPSITGLMEKPEDNELVRLY